MNERNWLTDYEIDQYIESTKDLDRVESLDALRDRLIRERDETLARNARGERTVVGEFEAQYGVRAPFKPSPNTMTVPGRMTFTVLHGPLTVNQPVTTASSNLKKD